MQVSTRRPSFTPGGDAQTKPLAGNPRSTFKTNVRHVAFQGLTVGYKITYNLASMASGQSSLSRLFGSFLVAKAIRKVMAWFQPKK